MVLNDPAGLSQALNKLYFQHFPAKVRPTTLVTRDRDHIRAFVAEHAGYAVLKPLQGSGGEGVFLVQPEDAPNLNQMIDAVVRDGYVAAQEYLPEALKGDLRLLMMNGRPLEVDGICAAFRRVRVGDDLRSNMRVGGQAVPAEVDETVLRIAELVGPRLVNDGMFLVGLDIAGDKLIEANVFSPGGFGSAHRFTGIDFTPTVIAALEEKLCISVAHYGWLSSGCGRFQNDHRDIAIGPFLVCVVVRPHCGGLGPPLGLLLRGDLASDVVAHLGPVLHAHVRVGQQIPVPHRMLRRPPSDATTA